MITILIIISLRINDLYIYIYITIFNGKIHYKWPFSIAMLNNQMVYQNLCEWSTPGRAARTTSERICGATDPAGNGCRGTWAPVRRGKIMGASWGKMGESLENRGKNGKKWENHGKMWENHGKKWENHGKKLEKSWGKLEKSWENVGNSWDIQEHQTWLAGKAPN